MKKPVRTPTVQLPEPPDPYDGSSRYTIPMPLSVEHDSDTVWQDFKDTDEKLDAQFAKTDLIELKSEDRK